MKVRMAADRLSMMLPHIRVWLILSAVLCSGSGCLLDTSPPDLDGCTRLEIRYQPSLLAYLTYGDRKREILIDEERRYLESLKVIVIDDAQTIEAFALDVSLGSYRGSSHGVWPDKKLRIDIACYRGEKRLTSFFVCSGSIVTDDQRMFAYPAGVNIFSRLNIPDVQSLGLRMSCAANMQRLRNEGPLCAETAESYPPPGGWCDAVVQYYQSQCAHSPETGRTWRRYSDEAIQGLLACPSAQESLDHVDVSGESSEPNVAPPIGPFMVSHYAMDPNCKPDSPGDMVLLFETKVGWNQHGGPALFTFDNHDPKGGCVLLNDSTVRFIRTEEALHALRWE